MVADGLARTGYDEVTPHVAVERRLLAASSDVRRRSSCSAGNVAVSLPSLAGRRLHRRHRQRDPEGAPHRADVRPRGRHVADAPGHQQADHRGGPVRRGRVRVQPGLAAGQALLPDRPAHRDRRGRARASPTWPASCAAIGRSPHQGRRRSRPASAGSCRSRRPRSSGSARTPSASCSDKVGLLRDATRRDRGVQLRWHDPAATLAEGIASRGDRRIGAVIEDVWRAGGTFQEWSEQFDLDRWTDGDGPPRAVDRLVRPPRARPQTRSCRGPTSPPGCTPTSCGRTGRTRWPRPCSRTADGRRATTAGPAPGTASSTWWLAGAAGRRQPGHRPGASTSPCPVRRRHGRSGPDEGPVPLHQAGQGPLDQPPRRRPHVGAGVPSGVSCPSRTPSGFTPRPKVSFGLALPTGHESVAEYLDVELETRRRSTSPALPGRLEPPPCRWGST